MSTELNIPLDLVKYLQVKFSSDKRKISRTLFLDIEICVTSKTNAKTCNFLIFKQNNLRSLPTRLQRVGLESFRADDFGIITR